VKRTEETPVLDDPEILRETEAHQRLADQGLLIENIAGLQKGVNRQRVQLRKTTKALREAVLFVDPEVIAEATVGLGVIVAVPALAEAAVTAVVGAINAEVAAEVIAAVIAEVAVEVTAEATEATAPIAETAEIDRHLVDVNCS
jgi:hypothetical protein